MITPAPPQKSNDNQICMFYMRQIIYLNTFAEFHTYILKKFFSSDQSLFYKEN